MLSKRNAPNVLTKGSVRLFLGCWEWIRSCSSGGYGHAWIDGGHIYAHRLSYEVHKGKIPDGLTIDHLCRNRKCVNPEHLEAVTRRVNNLRGTSPSAWNYRKTHCISGHEFNKENTDKECA